jgi:hypothetical protein
MIPIIQENRRPSLGQRLSAGIGTGLQSAQQMMAQQQQQQALQELGIPANLPPELQKVALAEKLKGESKRQLLGEKLGAIKGVFGGNKSDLQQEIPSQQNNNQTIDPSNFPDEAILELAAIDPVLGRELRAAKDTALKEKNRIEKSKRDVFESERSFHSGYSKKAEDEINQLRNVIPKKEMAFNFARDAIQSGNMSYLSPDKLADATGIDAFRTAKGAQLITAGKENLLNNLSRVSARAQNLWMEQRMSSMFPKIGQSKEANLTVQEMLDAELEMEKAYVNAFDDMSSQDEEKYGFVKKDIAKRARQAVTPLEKEIMKSTSYRLKEIEEQEKGQPSLKKQVGKNVIKNTPLTLQMAALYVEKFGDKALQMAENNGYYIPTKEEFTIFKRKKE